VMSKPRLARIGGSVRRIVCSAYEQDSFAIDLLNHFSVPNIRVDLACPNRLLAAITLWGNIGQKVARYGFTQDAVELNVEGVTTMKRAKAWIMRPSGKVVTCAACSWWAAIVEEDISSAERLEPKAPSALLRWGNIAPCSSRLPRRSAGTQAL